jgi:four helix bundle protein
MATFEKFEDMLAWQKARQLANEVYTATSNGKFSKDFALRDQIRRASVSIVLNIAEGFARRTNKEFSQFLFVAHGSIAEVQAALYIALDQKYLTKESFDELYVDCTEVSRIVSGLIKHLRNS